MPELGNNYVDRRSVAAFGPRDLVLWTKLLATKIRHARKIRGAKLHAVSVRSRIRESFFALIHTDARAVMKGVGVFQTLRAR